MPFELFTDRVNDYRQCVPWLLPKILTHPSDIIKEPFTAGLESFQSAAPKCRRRGGALGARHETQARKSPICSGEVSWDLGAKSRSGTGRPEGSLQPPAPRAARGWAISCRHQPWLRRAAFQPFTEGTTQPVSSGYPGFPPCMRSLPSIAGSLHSLGSWVNAGGYTA